MRWNLTRMLLVGVMASATVVAVAPVASAAGGDTIRGGCFFTSDEVVATNETGGNAIGAIGDQSFTQDAAGLPVDATVSCQIRFNDVPAPGTTFSYSGIGVQAGVDTISFTIPPLSQESLCQRAVFADGTDTGWNCTLSFGCACPPPADFVAALHALLAPVTDLLAPYVDPAACPVLAANAGSYGPVTIKPDGDVYLLDPLAPRLNPIYDCPPHGNSATW
ncbi:MAG: hypothetical protein QOC82_2458 [Frankiaceae bacterium]|nr:hypothetical protein [Frankiaceae bacterium]